MRALGIVGWYVLAVVGCGGGMEGGDGGDGGHDGGAVDSGRDAGPTDAGSDAGPTDAGSDAGSDAGPTDAGSDAGPTDAGSDAGFDAGSDAGVDAGPSCMDTLRNGDETDVDCGGTACPHCAEGLHCAADSDCTTGQCRLGLCLDLAGTTCGTGGPTTVPGLGFADPTTFSSDTMMHGVGSIVADGSGGFYAADAYGSGISGDRVLHVDASGVATTLAPTGGDFCVVTQLVIQGTTLYLYNALTNTLQSVTPAGVVSDFSTVGAIGGGSACTDTGVIGLLARPDGSFVVGSPGTSALYTLSADGLTRTTLLSPALSALRLAPNDATSILAMLGGVITRVDLGPPATATPILDASSVSAVSLIRDGAGAIYFGAGRDVLRVEADGTGTTLVARCFPGPITDVLFAPATAGGGTSLYVTQYGATIDAADGDAIHELARTP